MGEVLSPLWAVFIIALGLSQSGLAYLDYEATGDLDSKEASVGTFDLKHEDNPPGEETVQVEAEPEGVEKRSWNVGTDNEGFGIHKRSGVVYTGELDGTQKRSWNVGADKEGFGVHKRSGVVYTGELDGTQKRSYDFDADKNGFGIHKRSGIVQRDKQGYGVNQKRADKQGYGVNQKRAFDPNSDRPASGSNSKLENFIITNLGPLNKTVAIKIEQNPNVPDGPATRPGFGQPYPGKSPFVVKPVVIQRKEGQKFELDPEEIERIVDLAKRQYEKQKDLGQKRHKAEIQRTLSELSQYTVLTQEQLQRYSEKKNSPNEFLDLKTGGFV